MEKLYEEYGRLMVQKEVIDNKILEIRKKLSVELNKSPKKN